MRTKRQPTIMTLLLLMVVVAVQCATIPKPVYGTGNLRLDYYNFFSGCALVTGILFWSALPLAVALFVRPTRQVVGVGFAFGLTAIGVEFFSISLTPLAVNSVASWIWRGICYGPCGCLAPIRTWWWATYADRMPVLLTLAINAGWLITYTMTYFLIARSCRLREQPGASA